MGFCKTRRESPKELLQGAEADPPSALLQELPLSSCGLPSPMGSLSNSQHFQGCSPYSLSPGQGLPFLLACVLL